MPIRDGLIAAFDEILSYARQWALEAPKDPVTAVHEYRKSIRRARSMLRMLRASMATETHDRLAMTLRELHRATSAQRDRDVLIDTANKLDLAAKLPWFAARLLQPQLDRDDETRTTESSIDLLRAGAARLEGLPGVFGAALPAEVTWQDLAKGVRQIYRRARRDMNATLHSINDESLHDWRKRNKELMYQVELLTSGTGCHQGKQTRKDLAQLSECLGEIVDAIVLAETADRLAERSERVHAAKVIAKAKKKRVRRALERGAVLMHDRPTSFARRLIRGVRDARRDDCERADRETP